MAAAESWRSLHLAKAFPQLLIKTRFGDDGYEIQLTDLSRVWGESLKKHAIASRAGDIRCSIDPSEDDQYQILLEKIGDALSHKKGTSLDLKPAHDGTSMAIDLTAPLPGSLPKFEWTIELDRLPDATVGSELVTPLLVQANRLQHKMQHLIDELAAKDRVIAKLTDRLETTGNDLTACFPGASHIKVSRKKTQKEQLASHVRGLAEFNEEDWRASAATESVGGELSSDIMDAVLKGVPSAAASQSYTRDAESWWTKTGNTQTRKHRSIKPETSKIPFEDSHGDFQRQDTPPTLRQRHHTPATADGTTDDEAAGPTNGAVQDADETTEDEGDLNPSSSRKTSHTEGRSQQNENTAVAGGQSSNSPRKLGVIGGRRAKSAESEPESEANHPPARRKSRLGAVDGKKSPQPQPEPDVERVPETQLESPPQAKRKLGGFGGKNSSTASQEAEAQRPCTPKPKSKLGAFGGKSNASPTTPETATEAVKKEPSSGKKHRLGAFGGKANEDAEMIEAGLSKAPLETGRPSPHVIEDERKSRAQEKEAPPEEREDSEERAAKNREKLKRALGDKAKVTTKKKRKF